MMTTMTLAEATRMLRKVVDKVEEAGYTIYDAQTADQNKEVSYSVICCMGSSLFIQTVQGLDYAPTH